MGFLIVSKKGRNRGIVFWALSLVFCATLILSTINTLPLIERLHWLLEVNLSLAIYYGSSLICLIPVALVIFKDFSKWTRPIFGALYLWNVYFCIAPLYPFYFAFDQQKVDGSKGERITLLYANLARENKNPERFVKTLSNCNPDLVALVEYSDEGEERIGLKQLFEFSVLKPQSDAFGVALFSRLPVTGEPVTSIGEDLPPAIFADLQLAGDRLVAIGVIHAFPPVSQDLLYYRRVMLKRFASLVRHRQGDIILAGDFNASLHSAEYKQFIGKDQFRDAMYGFGLFRTWNAFNPIFRFSIDHVLFRGQLSVEEFTRMEPFGSDHFALCVRFMVGD